MAKIGDIREDGRVYVSKNKGSVGGEYWATMENFLRQFGADYYERREERAQFVPQTIEEKKAKTKAWYERVGRQIRMKNIEKIRRQGHESYLRRKDSEEFKQKRREACMRHHYKKNAAKILARAEKDRLRAEEKERKAVELALKKELAAQKKAAAALAKSLRPPRVLLTEEQRKERERGRHRNYKHRRRALLRGQESKATPSQIRKLEAKFKGICHYCGTKHKKLTLDHVIPLAKGGGHTLDNIVFACHMCNSSKRDLDAHEFAAQFGMLIV